MNEEVNKSGQESKCRDAHEESTRGCLEVTASSDLDARDVCFLLDMDGGGGLCFEAVAASGEDARRDGSGD